MLHPAHLELDVSIFVCMLLWFACSGCGDVVVMLILSLHFAAESTPRTGACGLARTTKHVLANTPITRHKLVPSTSTFAEPNVVRDPKHDPRVRASPRKACEPTPTILAKHNSPSPTPRYIPSTAPTYQPRRKPLADTNVVLDPEHVLAAKCNLRIYITTTSPQAPHAHQSNMQTNIETSSSKWAGCNMLV